MAITLTELPTVFPFTTGTKAANNAFPTVDSFPNMRESSGKSLLPQSS